LAVALTFVLVLAACPTGGGDGGGPSASAEPITYTVTAPTGESVEIIISKTPISSRAVANGDYYVIKVNNVVISKGKITVEGNEGSYSFIPDSNYGGNDFKFSVTLSDKVLAIPSIPGSSIAGIFKSLGTDGPEEIYVEAKDFETEFEKINNTPGEYVIVLTSDLTDFPGTWIDNPGVKITVKGQNGIKKITWQYNAAKPSNLFWVGKGHLVLEDVEISRSAGNTEDSCIIGVGTGTLEITNGVTLDGGNINAGVWLESGGFIMSGGKITKCDNAVGTNGRGTAIAIKGGAIQSNNFGITVSESTNSTVAISGGTIDNNTTNGIGVFESKNSTVAISGGTISNSTEQGVNISESSGISATIAGGDIKGNEYGVAIYKGAGNNFLTMTGGTISGNQKKGLIVNESPNSGFKKTGGIIYGNNAGTDSNAEGAIIVETNNSNRLQLSGNAMGNASGNYAATMNSAGTGIATKSGNW